MELQIGCIYGDLECVKIARTDNRGRKYYKMKCTVCGREKEMLISTIKLEKGIKHKSCGRGLKTKDSVFYSRWEAMRTRTTNKNYWASKHYSERGINSDEFELFIDFYDNMYEDFVKMSKLYGAKNVSLDRIDVNKSYTKDNCRWVYIKEQNGNQRKNKFFEAKSPCGDILIAKNVSKFAREHNLNRGAISNILNGRGYTHKGWKFKYIK